MGGDGEMGRHPEGFGYSTIGVLLATQVHQLAMEAHTLRICFKHRTLMNGGCLVLLLQLCRCITWCIHSAGQSLSLLFEQSAAVVNADIGNERERRLTPATSRSDVWGSRMPHPVLEHR